MEVYAQVRREPGKKPEVIALEKAPDGWDDSEEQELQHLAQGAGLLAWQSLQSVDKVKAEEQKRLLKNELRTPGLS